ncbi:MAG: ATPase, T2SS/T4P/T4SS family [Planctomycetota bacterium]
MGKTAEAAPATRRRIGEILVEQGIVTEKQVKEALDQAKTQGGALGQMLIQLGYAAEEDVVHALASQAGMEVVKLESLDTIPAELLDKVGPSLAKIYRIVPVKMEDNTLTVAMADPLNMNALDDLRLMLDCDVRGAVSTESAVDGAIERFYADRRESVEEIIDEMDETRKAFELEYTDSSRSYDLEQLQEMAMSAPVIKLLNLILLQAIKDQSSDIHFEPFEEEFKVRYRVDGVLYEMIPPPRHLALAVVSRIKVMADLDIAETRLPQDGRIELMISGNPVDLRVSTLPTLFGESVVMRVLDRSVVALDLDRVGLRGDELEIVKTIMDKPHGIVLVTGPTGCGKTTTLYSALNYANDVGLKIITTEDPVEYDLAGIIQVQINESIGKTFAACLRSILRQDPDKILVGETRDLETAEIAIQASLTGHLVLSTLHTNDAPSAITRMIDMPVEPFLLCATLEMIVAQRLVRNICTVCKREYEPSEDMLDQLQLTPDETEGRTFYYGAGCPECNNTGYRGRTAIFEIMQITERMRELIMAKASTQAMRDLAREEGMRTMRESGLLKIFDGTTTIEEVVRETLAAQG